MDFNCLSLYFITKNIYNKIKNTLPLWFSNWIEICLFPIVIQHLWTVQKQSARWACECHGNAAFLNHEKHGEKVLYKMYSSSQCLHNYLISGLTFKRIPNIFCIVCILEKMPPPLWSSLSGTYAGRFAAA